MAQPTIHRRSADAVRAYTAELHRLTELLRLDPLDENTSVALVDHIISNRATAAALRTRILDDQAVGIR